MIYLPYHQLNIVDNTFIPSTVKVRNNRAYGFWERSLFQRACSTIIFDVPDTWEGNIKDFLYWCLFRYGFVAVFSTDKLGTVYNPCTLSGFDFYYQPTRAIIANPALSDSLDLTIGKDCELLKLTPDYQGIWDIIGYYAGKLAELDTSVNVSILNSKYSWLVGAKNKAAAETMKKAFDSIQKGNPLTVVDAKLPDDPASKDTPFQFLDFGNLKENYILSDLLQDWSTIINAFDTEVGIPTLPYQKKERMVVSEAESRIVDSTSRSVIWYDTLDNSVKEVNRMFPDLNLSVELRYKDSFEDQEESEGLENE